MTLFYMSLFMIGIGLTVAFKISVIWALLFGLFCFFMSAKHAGKRSMEILFMMKNGMATSLSVIKVFVFIGLITASWRACGTISYFVYWGIKIIAPQWFILCAFLITCFISFLLGTSFGTVGTIGTVLIVLAKSGGVSLLPVAGAIISGAYFGDRCAPTSSSLTLVCTLTKSNLYETIKVLVKSSLPAFILSCLFYGVISFFYPLNIINFEMADEISTLYNLNHIVIVPAVIILILPLLKIGIKKSMLISAVSAFIIALILQKENIFELSKALILGYVPAFDGWFAPLIKGGGIISMLTSAIIVLLASTYAGIIKGTDIFSGLEKLIDKIKNKTGRPLATVIVAFITALFACNQALCIMLTHQMTDRENDKDNVPPLKRATSLANSAVVIAPLIPWNIAVSIPLQILGAPSASIVFSVYLFLLPITWVIFEYFNKRKDERK